MSIARHHAEWLSLVEVSGPFLSMPVLMRAFPQGLEAHDPERLRLLKSAYDEWQEKQGTGKFNPAIHAAWIKFILTEILRLTPEVIAEGQAIPQTLYASIPEQGEVLRPDLVIKNLDGGPNAGKPRLLIQTYEYHQDLDKPVRGHTWKATPGTRMMELLHATGVRLGLVTNGEHWMLVDAPKNDTTGFASWYAHGWAEFGEGDHVYLRSFTSLLNVERFFNVADSDTLEAMLAESASNQQEVTDQLGYQVRRAVEVLVQSLDRADQDHGRALLTEVSETELYEAALTVMMRLVFLFCAEERGLFLLEDDLYSRNYAVSTVREQLRETADQHGEEILERRHDAWCRLLSTFRAVFGGVQHDRLTLPAYGGRLFDPDRFPFLEGRQRDTKWQDTPASPLPVNNRTVLHLMEALQILQMKVPGGGPPEARRLSFKGLDIEQIGHVYEGLLDHTAKRATEPVLGLDGTKDKEPEIALSKLEELRAKGQDALVGFLREETSRSESSLKKALTGEIGLEEINRLQAVCGSDKDLLKRVTPFAGLIRDDTFSYPVVIPKGSVFVTAGTDRRSSGTHYTPRSLTEPIVQYTLEPLVFVGPAEGEPKEQWKLHSPAELLDLKVCDMACGSGAFLVQACRYLSERLVEAWEAAEKAHPGTPGITPEGLPSTGQPGEQLIPKETDERIAYAMRLVAQRCLYGVDINPLAAEMAKLSLWLLTLAKDKPFTFLDHAIRCGDSLLGIHDLKQLKTFSLDGTSQQYVFGEEPLEELVDKAIELRLKIESMASNTVEDVEAQARLMAECEQRVEYLRCAADMLIAAELKGSTPREKLANRDNAAVRIAYYLKNGKSEEFRAVAARELAGRKTFHWPLNFPEMCATHTGFHALIGNPPFMGGKKISGVHGVEYRAYLVDCIAHSERGNADLCAYFFLRSMSLLLLDGHVGLLATNSIGQGDTRVVGLDQLVNSDFIIIRAVQSRPWPGQANLEISEVWLRRGQWHGRSILDETCVQSISSYLTEAEAFAGKPYSLRHNLNSAFIGVVVYGEGFVISTDKAIDLLKDSRNRDVVLPYLNGEDVNTSPTQEPQRFVIDFADRPLEQAQRYPQCLQIITDLVKPFRCTVGEKHMREKWWLHQRPRPAMRQAIASLGRVLVTARISPTCAVTFVSSDYVLNDKLVVFPFDTDDAFALLQSEFHWSWVRQYTTTLGGTTLSYSPTDCFHTFPFPAHTSLTGLPPHEDLAQAGQSVWVHRREVLECRQEGLTSLYNRFNSRDEAARDIETLRELNILMDKAVAAAYGWDDLDLCHGFHQTKQGIRFTISEPARREVLTRLLRLNHERYAEEVAQGLHEKGKKTKAKGTGKRQQTDSTGTLF